MGAMIAMIAMMAATLDNGVNKNIATDIALAFPTDDLRSFLLLGW